jgi:ketosteroid isomerase-like protein
VLKKDMQSAIVDYFKKFTDLKVTVNEMFFSQDGTRLAIQWDWTVTRKRDRKRTTTHDAIFVRLVGGKIARWNEYYG